MTILAYHSIDDFWKNDLAVSPRAFEKQIAYIAQNCEPLDIATYVEELRAGSLPPQAVAITFDDGYLNFATRAVSVLKRYGVPATVFVTTGPVGSDELLGWQDSLPPQNAPMSWEQIRELSKDPSVTIGSHTVSHSNLTQLRETALAAELEESKRVLEEETGTACDWLSYPYGFHDSAVRASARRAGYKGAFTLPTGPEESDSGFAIPRIGVFRRDGRLVFKLKVNGTLERFKRTSLWAFIERFRE